MSVVSVCKSTITMKSQCASKTSAFRLVCVRDSNPGISAVFANPESRDWRRPNPGILGLQKLVKSVLFRVLNDRNNNYSRLMNKILHLR